MSVTTLRVKDSASERVLYMALELSSKHWQLVFGDGLKRRRVRIEAGNRGRVGCRDRAGERALSFAGRCEDSELL